MMVRDITARDRAALEALFRRQGFAYELPDLGEFIAKLTIADGDNLPRLAIGARRTCELYMLADDNWLTPGLRFEALKTVHEAMRQRLVGLGFSDVHVWLPPQIEKSFGRRLMRDFGWSRPEWTDFTRSTAL